MSNWVLLFNEKGKVFRYFNKKSVFGWKSHFYSFRDIMTKNSRIEQGKNLTKLPQVKTFSRLVGTQHIETTRLKNMMGAWNNNFIPGKIRKFLFKFYNNILGLNSRVAKFNRITDPSCTICSLTNCRPTERETISHLFFYCESTNRILA